MAAINVAEIMRGVWESGWVAVHLLFAGLVVVPIDSDAVWQAGVWRRDHACQGSRPVAGRLPGGSRHAARGGRPRGGQRAGLPDGEGRAALLAGW